MKYDLYCPRCNLYLFCWGWYACWIWQGEADSWNIRGGPSLSKVSLFVCLSNLLGIHNQWTLFSTIRLQLNLYCLSLSCFFSLVFVFRRESDSIITNVRRFVLKTPFILHPSSFTLHPSSFNLHPSTFNGQPSFRYFKLFSLFNIYYTLYSIL